MTMMSFLHRIFTDARFGLRLLRRAPVFGATLFTILVVGIGATTAMFSLVSSLLLRPLPFPHAEELTMMWVRQPQVTWSPISLPDFLDWKAGGTTFQSMALIEYTSFSLSTDKGTPENLPGSNVTGEYFPTLGLAPLRGRLLTPEDDHVRGPRVAVISASVWHRRFGSDPGIVGKALTLNGEPYTVVGVAEEGFRFSGPYSANCDVWTPFAVTHDEYVKEAAEYRGNHSYHAIGRRKPGVSLDQAQAQMVAVSKTLAEKYPDSNANVTANLRDLQWSLVKDSRDSLLVLFGAVLLVFLIVCANVANLLLARAVTRRPEMAARMALGATRGRLVAQLLTETLAMFVVAAAFGTLLARSLVAFVAAGFLSGQAVMATVHVDVDGRALLFAIGMSALAGVVFGLAPAIEAQRIDPHTVLKESGARASIGRAGRLFRGGLVVAQIALAFALLVGSGLLLRSFAKTAATSPGFDSTDVVTGSLTLPLPKYADNDKAEAFWHDIVTRVAAQPGVTSAALNSALPFGDFNSNGDFTIEGRPPWPERSGPLLERNAVTPGYFKTMGIPLLRGRDITDADVDGARRVMVVSKAVADRFFPGEDPLGRRIGMGEDDKGEPRWWEIVGIVGDVLRWTLENKPQNEAYMPLAQYTQPWASIVVRTPRPDALARELPAVIASVDSSQAIGNVRRLQDRVDASLGSERFVARLLTAFAAVALLLATLGIFGVVSYTTVQRTRELGIRIALGASPEGVIRLVMRDGMRLLGIGLAVGFAGAIFLSRAGLESVIGTTRFDGLVFGVVFAALALAGAGAALLPALRAVRVPPAVALRYE
jgi:putative ABC transport system permease protein